MLNIFKEIEVIVSFVNVLMKIPCNLNIALCYQKQNDHTKAIHYALGRRFSILILLIKMKAYIVEDKAIKN